MTEHDRWVAIGSMMAIAAGAVLTGWAGWWLAARFSGAEPLPGGPPDTIKAMIDGEASWPMAATWWTVALLLVLIVTVFAVFRGPREPVDRAAKRLPRKGLARYRPGRKGAQGPVIGKVVTGRRRGQTIAMTTEDQAVIIAGPRVGKTRSIAIPAIIGHTEGPLIVTSNKRDIADAAARRPGNGQVWLLDPQQLASDGIPTWWWDPLATADTVSGAKRLAALWAHAARDPGAKTDAYFDNAGEQLLAAVLLAASLDGGGVRQAARWLQDIDNQGAQNALRAGGIDILASDLEATQGLPDKQRAGVVGTAAKALGWVADPDILRWAENPHGDLDLFDPLAFVHSNDTLILISREGEASASGLVTAMTAAVLRTAESEAASRPDGRCDPPILGVLDEAANVCRWRELPDLYSHFGSRGIMLMSFFQSWAQIESAFTKEGAEKLWSAANVRAYLGGVSDTQFLKRLSDLSGHYEHRTNSSSLSGQGTTRSRSQQRREQLTVAELAAMPPGRALVLLSAASPVVAETSQYNDRDLAPETADTPPSPIGGGPEPDGNPTPNPIPTEEVGI